MRFKDIAARLTGFSVPVFGISWQPGALERDEAQRLIAFLEDRRVLYIPSDIEVPEHCLSSVQEIRRFLTDLIGRVRSESDLVLSARAMRGECRKFVERVEDLDLRLARQWGHYQSWIFADALGQLRGMFGVHIASICTRYGIDIESQLAEILPASID